MRGKAFEIGGQVGGVTEIQEDGSHIEKPVCTPMIYGGPPRYWVYWHIKNGYEKAVEVGREEFEAIRRDCPELHWASVGP
jgi:hypothetical protein